MSTIMLIGGAFVLAASIVSANPTSPYAGQEHRDIKALSAQDIQGYREGKGMGLAKAAELNHYPGPTHVLQLEDKLQLTPEQKAQTERIYATMDVGAKSLGNTLIEKERQLDALFASGKVESVQLQSLLQEIGRLQAEVRNAHLQAHLQQKAVLTPPQVAAYDALRGYASGGASTQGQAHDLHAH